MNQLPTFDRATRRSEIAVFTSLGLAGLITVSLAVIQIGRYVAGSDRIASALSAPQESPVTTAANKARMAITNVVDSATRRAASPAVAPGKV